MTDAKFTEHVTRETILNLLSNAETAKVSNAEGAAALTVGDDFVDLEHLDQGVQRANASTKVVMGYVLPRSAVSQETWSKIMAQLAN